MLTTTKRERSRALSNRPTNISHSQANTNRRQFDSVPDPYGPRIRQVPGNPFRLFQINRQTEGDRRPIPRLSSPSYFTRPRSSRPRPNCATSPNLPPFVRSGPLRSSTSRSSIVNIGIVSRPVFPVSGGRPRAVVMAFCHACHRPTQVAERVGNEPTCASCGTVGFVEVVAPDEQHGPSSQTSDEDEFFGMSSHPGLRTIGLDVRDPFRPIEMFFHNFLPPSLSSALSFEGGSSLFEFESDATAGRRTPFHDVIPAAFIPDAIAQMLTGDNLPNILQLLMSQTSSTQQNGPPPASLSVRNGLPRQILTTETATGQCAVCQEDLKAGDEVIRLTLESKDCSHAYHPPCLLPWLENHNSCPVCRFELPTDDPEYEARKNRLRRDLETSMRSRNQHSDGPMRDSHSSNYYSAAEPRLRPTRPQRYLLSHGPACFGHNNLRPNRSALDERTSQRETGHFRGGLGLNRRQPQPYFGMAGLAPEGARPASSVLPTHLTGMNRAVGSPTGAWRSTLSGLPISRAQSANAGAGSVSPNRRNTAGGGNLNNPEYNNGRTVHHDRRRGVNTGGEGSPPGPSQSNRRNESGLPSFANPLEGIMNTWRSVWRMNADSSSHSEIPHNNNNNSRSAPSSNN